MPNIKATISSHNKKILRAAGGGASQYGEGCNCQGARKTSCPLQGNCKKKSLVYRAEVKEVESSNTMYYLGLTGGMFKDRWRNHKSSFNLPSREHETSLSTHIWDLKRRGINFDIQWSIVEHAPMYTPESKTCHLCTAEKTHIARAPADKYLNSRSELMSKCRHRDKYLLTNVAGSYQHLPGAPAEQEQRGHIQQEQGQDQETVPEVTRVSTPPGQGSTSEPVRPGPSLRRMTSSPSQRPATRSMRLLKDPG